MSQSPSNIAASLCGSVVYEGREWCFLCDRDGGNYYWTPLERGLLVPAYPLTGYQSLLDNLKSCLENAKSAGSRP
jgi:hypothetical protein